ncbi:hypothetical protein C8F04DRAFT_1191960 [Mycena alexandri]|uniref:Uncharacterized protein n=1 Tax=Mycena alexandri TaxID=1745969 RepID=A0AAD6SBY2_9AGAR|nr:hypothetical protein C8F04DRAFT_1191960 [Mycena alexandri]
MMFKALALFGLLSAPFVSASVIPTPAEGRGIFPLNPLFTACVNKNLNQCASWYSFGLASACASLDDPVNSDGIALANQISSVGTLDARTACTIFTSTTCSGKSLFVNGTINDLSAFGFDNIANSFSCRALYYPPTIPSAASQTRAAKLFYVSGLPTLMHSNGYGEL